MNATLLDIALSLTLIFLAWKILTSKKLFISVVLFIVFGLIMALAWVQLMVPDIALVEIAIGAGLTGALFLGTLGRLESSKDRKSLSFMTIDYTLLFTTGILAAILCWSIFYIPMANGLSDYVLSNMSKSGVGNPVVAVVVNFRAYDTFLEVGVLLLVGIAVTEILGLRKFRMPKLYFSSHMPLKVFLQFMAPLTVSVALYLLWVGTYIPGGAFQAGSILGGTGLLLLLGGVDVPIDPNYRIWKYAFVAGFGGFLLVGLLLAFFNRAFLEYPIAAAKYLILLIESLCTLSVAVIFISLFKLCSGIAISPIEEEDN
ncbi:MAG: hydrogen gas-evolving membrane-bound hydrogenase subunit E [Waddliaceae bacterium]